MENSMRKRKKPKKLPLKLLRLQTLPAKQILRLKQALQKMVLTPAHQRTVSQMIYRTI